MKLIGYAQRLDEKDAPGGSRWHFLCPDHPPIIDEKRWAAVHTDRPSLWTVECEICGVNLSRVV